MKIIVEDNPSTLEIHYIDTRDMLVIRKQVSKDDDWLGRIHRHYEDKYSAKAEFKGSATNLRREFKSEDEAIKWLAELAPDVRSCSYYSYREEVKQANRERARKDRRDNPQWYNPDGSHIGINSDGSFRSSYRNTR